MQQKLQSGSGGSGGMPFLLGFSRKEMNIKSLSTASTASKLDLYQATKQLDQGNGAEMEEIQKLMDCKDKDFEEYVVYGKKQGLIFEPKRGFLKLLE